MNNKPEVEEQLDLCNVGCVLEPRFARTINVIRLTIELE